MRLDEYQRFTQSTAIYPKHRGLEYTILGLAGEAAEICNKYKKVLRDDNEVLSDEKRKALIDELGDCMWYVSQMAYELGTSVEDILESNCTKLQSRQERGVLKGSGDSR